jgi:hypothetical protein
MKTFCHINELGPQGYDSLRALVLVSDRVSIWGPAAKYLEHLRRYHPLLPGTQELLWYIRNGHVQILARKQWLTDPDFRNSGRWLYGKWVDSFDGELFEIRREDRKNRASASARVRDMHKERGNKWAEHQIDSKRVNPQGLMKAATSVRGALLGSRERIAGLSTKKAATVLLRDAYNHGEAFRESGADRNLGLPSDGKLLTVFANSAHVSQRSKRSIQQSMPSAREVVNAISAVLDRLQNAGKPVRHSEEAFERVQIILSSPKELTEFREWVRLGDQLAASGTTADYERELCGLLVRQLRVGFMRDALLGYIEPGGSADGIASIASIILATLGFRTGNTTAPIRATTIGTDELLGAMQWIGWVSAADAGPQWARYIAEGSKSRSRVRLEALIKSLVR